MILQDHLAFKDCLFNSVCFFLVYFIYQKIIIFSIKDPYQDYFLDISAAFKLAGSAHYYSFLSYHYGFRLALPFYAVERIISSFFSHGGLNNPIDNITMYMEGDLFGLFRFPFQIVGSVLASKFSLLLWRISYGENFVNINPSVDKDSMQGYSVSDFMCQQSASYLASAFYYEFFGSIFKIFITNLETKETNMTNKIAVVLFNIIVIIKCSYSTSYVMNPLYVISFYIFCPHRTTLLLVYVYCIAPLLGSVTANVIFVQIKKCYPTPPPPLPPSNSPQTLYCVMTQNED